MAWRPRLWGWLRAETPYGIELFALCGLAFTQPLLDVFGRTPEQFAFRGIDPRGVVEFALAVTFLPTAALWLGEIIVSAVTARGRRALHAAVGILLVVAAALQVLTALTSGPVRVLGALAIGGGAVLAVLRFAPLRTWLRYMAVAPVMFLLLFLVASPSARLLSDPNAAAISEGVGNPVPVVMLVFDELPLNSLMTSDGTIDEELFPNFAAFADRANWYRNTTSVSSSTWYAVPALATGQMVENGPAPIAADHPESLFTLLGDTYDFNVTESVTRLCPSTLCDASPVAGGRRAIARDALDVLRARLSYDGPSDDPVAGFEEPDAERGDTEGGFADFDRNQPERVVSFLDGLGGDQSALHYLHLLLPHVPFRYVPSGARYTSPNPDLGRNSDDWTDAKWLADQGRQRHLLQVGYVDALLGQIVERLEATGTFDDALIVITADHGISFRAGGPIRAIEGQPIDAETMADVAWVPLFVKEPGQQGGTTSDQNAQTIDVVPTIADVLEIDIPWAVDGQSVLGAPRTDRAKPFLPSRVNSFGVDALDAVRADQVSSLGEVEARGVDTFLPPGGGADRWWSIGPRPELIGLGVSEAGAVASLSPVEVDLVDPGAYDVAEDAATVPALVHGRVDGVDPGDPVAVAIDGTIVATGMAYEEGDGTQFSAMVPPERFATGPNPVTVLRIA